MKNPYAPAEILQKMPDDTTYVTAVSQKDAERLGGKYFKNFDDVTDKKGYKEQTVPGFTMSAKTRPLVVSKMESYIREKVFVFRSKRLLEELRVFIWQNGKAQAQNGYNDDLVMSLGIGLFTRDTAMKFYEQGMDLNRAMVSSITKTGYIGGPTVPSGYQNPFMINDGRGGFEDISWVLG